MNNFNFGDFFRQYKWRIICIALGILFAVLIFTLGFWRTLLLFAITMACFFIGKWLDEGGESIGAFFARLFAKK